MRQSFLFLTLLLSGFFSKAQIDPATYNGPEFKPMMPPSPTAASIFKYSDVPVNHYTGVPDISIPIYEINSGQLKLPITLQYHAGGIKVAEDAGPVGLGWTIRAEDAIIQTAMGNSADNGQYQNPNSGGLNWQLAALMYNVQSDVNLLKQLSSGSFDGCPDVYSYTYGGESGKFIIADQVRLLPQRNISISRTQTGLGVYEWKIVSEDGTQYLYQDRETTREKNSSSVDNISNTWYITKIVSANGTDEISFTYSDAYYESRGQKSYSLSFWPFGEIGPCAANAPVTSPISASMPGTPHWPVVQTNGKQLSRIDFRNGAVIYDIDWNQRLDHPGASGTSSYNVPKIKKIFIENKEGKIIKAVHFNYDYYTASGGTPDYRLKLIGVHVNASANPLSVNTEKYQFDYNATPLPKRESNARDHWGYYNGVNSNTTLIPDYNNSNPPQINPTTCSSCSGSNTSSSYSLNYSGANRSVNPEFAKAGILQKVTYPTGGHVEFEFESNTIPPASPVYYTCSTATSTASYTHTVPNGSGVGYGNGWISIPNTPAYANGVCAVVTGNYAPSPGAQQHHIDHANTYVDARADGQITPLYRMHLPTTTSNSSSYAVNLLPGNDYFVTAGTTGDGFFVTGSLTALFPVEHVSPNRLVGGLRIKKITTVDQYSQKNNVRKFDYADPSSGFSSGAVFKQPKYDRNIYRYVRSLIGCTMPCGDAEKPGIQLSSNSITPIGGSAGYTFVRESFGNNGEGGARLFEFSNSYTNVNGNYDPDWRRGLLQKATTYDANNNMVASERNHYVTDPTTYVQFVGRSAALLGEHPCSGEDLSAYPIHFEQAMYLFPSEWIYIDSTITKRYAPTGTIDNVHVNIYNNTQHKNVTQTLDNASDATWVSTRRKYPSDYTIPASTSPNSEAGCIQKLKDRHIHNVPIETVVEQVSNGQASVISATCLTFQNDFNNTVLPGKKFVLDISQPMNGFQLSSVAASSAFIKNGAYRLQAEVTAYSESEQVADVTVDNFPQSTHYVYDGQFPSAAVTNAHLASTAFSGFETDEMGRWTYNLTGMTNTDKFTGRKSYNLTSGGSIQCSSLYIPADHPAGLPSSIVSYWRKGGSVSVSGTVATKIGETVSGWTYYEHTVNGGSGINVSGNGLIDDLRLYPPYAQMATYTHEPLIGVTSVSDIRNNVIFYEYDDFYRLKTVRDMNGSIVQKAEYSTQVSE